MHFRYSCYNLRPNKFTGDRIPGYMAPHIAMAMANADSQAEFEFMAIPVKLAL